MANICCDTSVSPASRIAGEVQTAARCACSPCTASRPRHQRWERVEFRQAQEGLHRIFQTGLPINQRRSASISLIAVTSVHLCAAVGAVRLFLVFSYATNPVMFSAMRAIASTTIIWAAKSDYPPPMHHRGNIGGGDSIRKHSRHAAPHWNIFHQLDKCTALNVFSHFQPSLKL